MSQTTEDRPAVRLQRIVPAMPGVDGQVERGWEGALDELTAALAQGD